MCDGCLAEVPLAGGKLKNCTCGLVSYCLVQCRDKHWGRHKKDCINRRKQMEKEEKIKKCKKELKDCTKRLARQKEKMGFEDMEDQEFIKFIQTLADMNREMGCENMEDLEFFQIVQTTLLLTKGGEH